LPPIAKEAPTHLVLRRCDDEIVFGPFRLLPAQHLLKGDQPVAIESRDLDVHGQNVAVTRTEALAFGLLLAASAIAVLALAVNATAAALLAFAIFFYIVV